MSSPVLGLNFGTHDAAAAVVHDGRVIAAVEEERLSRVKHTKAFPAHALTYCLTEAGMTAGEIDEVALFVDPKLQLLLAPANLWYGFPTALGSLASDLDKYRKRLSLPRTIRTSGIFQHHIRVIPVPHHRAHAASAYLTSPFEDALVVTLDGRGEYETACVYDGRSGQLRRRHHIVYPHSFGYLYSMLTRFLGFRPQRDEYKVMGLAAHGGPSLVRHVAELARLDDTTGRLQLDLRYFDHHRRPSAARNLYSPRLIELLGPPREAGDEITDRHRDIAYAAQQHLERLVNAFLAYAQRLVPMRNLCLAGGVALNCAANSAIITSDRFNRVYVQPAAGDAGTSVGAALITSAARTGVRRTSLDHTFLGPQYSDLEIAPEVMRLGKRGYRVTEVPDPQEQAARLLQEGMVIGWFQGRVEFGPRALGSRSILAPAVDAAVVDRINALIKLRELFRPLAPAVMDEYATDYFQLHQAGEQVYPFMLAIAPVEPSKRRLIPAVTHVDGSARVQTVSQETNPYFWSLIEAYRRRTGLPVVLNTSFNEADEPIVCSPQDAVRTFTACDLDALVIGHFVAEKITQARGELGWST